MSASAECHVPLNPTLMCLKVRLANTRLNHGEVGHHCTGSSMVSSRGIPCKKCVCLKSSGISEPLRSRDRKRREGSLAASKPGMASSKQNPLNDRERSCLGRVRNTQVRELTISGDKGVTSAGARSRVLMPLSSKFLGVGRMSRRRDSRNVRFLIERWSKSSMLNRS